MALEHLTNFLGGENKTDIANYSKLPKQIPDELKS